MNRFEMPPPDAEPESVAVHESADLFDYGQIKDYAIFALRAVQRHKLIVAVVYALVLAATGALLWALPKTYYVETKLLGQRNQVISALAVPYRAMPGEADAPARAAQELIKSRDSLLTLMKQTDLINHFYQHRAPAGAIKDWLFLHLGRVPSDEEKRETVLGMLEQRLAVNASWQSEGTVYISVYWPDPQMAYQLVKEAQENFRQARQSTEQNNIAEAISILERYAAEYQREVEAAADELDTVRARKATRAGRPAPPAPVRRRPVVDPALAELKSVIEGKERTLKDLEELHARRVAEVQARLDEDRRTYAEGHPIVMDTSQKLRAALVESPQIALLRQELDEKKAEYARRGGANEDVVAAAPLSAEIMRMQAEGLRESDSGEEYLKRHTLLQALSKYTQLQQKIDSAKIEFDTARAAFKYRYTVVKPAIPPMKPIRPAVVRTFAAGAIAGLLLALFAAVAIDVRSGEILELWQVERKLKLPVLAELR